MKNYFIIHGSFGDSKEHYLPWLKNELEKLGEVVCVDFPIGVGVQTFESWSKVLDQYKDKITGIIADLNQRKDKPGQWLQWMNLGYNEETLWYVKEYA